MSEALLKRKEEIDKENAAKKKAKAEAAAKKRIARQLAEIEAAEKEAAEKEAAKKALVIKRKKEIERQIAKIEAAEKEAAEKAAAREGAATEIIDTIESNESDILLTRYTEHNCSLRCHICESILKKGLCYVESHNILIKKTNTKKVSFVSGIK